MIIKTKCKLVTHSNDFHSMFSVCFPIPSIFASIIISSLQWDLVGNWGHYHIHRTERCSTPLHGHHELPHSVRTSVSRSRCVSRPQPFVRTQSLQTKQTDNENAGDVDNGLHMLHHTREDVLPPLRLQNHPQDCCWIAWLVRVCNVHGAGDVVYGQQLRESPHIRQTSSILSTADPAHILLVCIQTTHEAHVEQSVVSRVSVRCYVGSTTTWRDNLVPRTKIVVFHDNRRW